MVSFAIVGCSGGDDSNPFASLDADAGADSSSGSGGASTGGSAAATGGASAGGSGGSGTLVDGGPDGTAADCDPDTCDLPTTTPEGCAEAECVDGVCTFVARDADDDGFRSSRCVSRTPGVAVQAGDDCDDGDPSISPNGWDGPEGDGFAEGCNDDLDQNCNGLIDDGQLSSGATCRCTPGEAGACSETSAGIAIVFPGLEDGVPFGACRLGSRECLPNGTWGACSGAIGPAQETCDGDDNDCDGVPSAEDEDVVDRIHFVCDADRDDHAPEANAVTELSCSEPESGAGTSCVGQWLRNPTPTTFDDCDDSDAAKHPDEAERCDGKDNDCDDLTDESGAIGERVWSYDADGDGYRDQAHPVYTQCSAPSAPPAGCAGLCPADGWVDRAATPLPTNDCNDGNPTINPSATDLCNGVDADCDGSPTTGCACTGSETQVCGTHPEDGTGTCRAGSQQCSSGQWGACVGSVGPQTEDCTQADRDCDGLVGNVDPDADPLKTLYYRDTDGDGFGVTSTATLSCTQPPGWVVTPGDCADNNSSIKPGQPEVCNGVDDDCDTAVDAADPGLSGIPTNPGVTYACQGGTWTITACPGNTQHCDTNIENGCETNVATIENCRQCGNVCLFACGATDCVDVVGLTAGTFHTCAVHDDGRASCWGRNLEGRIGDTTSGTDRHVPTPVSALTGVVSVVAGGVHTCAIAGAASTAYCWGGDGDGQLGNGSAGSTTFPQAIQLTGVASLAAGAAHTCATQTDGTVQCWGSRGNGRLGDYCTIASCTGSQTSPGDVFRADFSTVTDGESVAVGSTHSCALIAGGTVECWGDNSQGQLGDGTTDASSDFARAVSGLSNVTAIAAGGSHACALSGGNVYCWGSNAVRQVGQMTGTLFRTPQQVAGVSNVTAIAVGASFSCARSSNGQVRCWGANDKGQLGDDVTGPTHTPTIVTTNGTTALANVVELAAGGDHACALRQNGQAHCWGGNGFGELGSGATSTGSPAAIPISPLNGG